MYTLKFQHAGHDVQCYTDPSVALEKLRTREHVDAVLLDLIMPKVTGFESIAHHT
jgi:CheY-like chemotaxis protein